MRTTLILIGLTAIGLAACDHVPTAPAAHGLQPGAPSADAVAEAPVPVGDRTFPFVLVGSLAEVMRGTFIVPGCEVPGTIDVTNAAAPVRRGATIHVSQTWHLVDPGPCRQQPVPAGDFVLDGIVNTVNGNVVLNGQTASGAPVHVRGVALSAGGVTSIVGMVTVEDPSLRPGG